MTITYVNDLRLSEMATGDNSGTWGNVTNTNLELIGDALGYGTEAITTNADTHSSTIADGSADAARAMYIKYTGTLDSACTITIGPNTISRVHIIENATSGSQNIIIKQGSGATVTIGSGAVKMVYLDGAGSGAAVTDALVDLDLTGTTTVAALTVSGAITGTTATFTTADNNAQVTLESTDTDANVGPILNLNRNVTGASSDFLGRITFDGKDDAGNATTYARIDTQIVDASNGSEDSALLIHSLTGGSERERVRITQTETVFNEGSTDLDFRIESDGSEKMFVVDGGSNFVSISGANGLSEVLNGGTASVNSVSSNAALEINTRSATNGHSGIINFIKAPNTSGTPTATADGEYLGRTSFIGADTGNTLRVGAQILAVQSGTDSDSVPSRLILNTSSGTSDPVNRFEIGTTETVVNEDSNDVDFRVEGNNHANAFFVNGEYDGVAINSNAPISYANAQAVLFIEDTANPAIGISDTGQSKDYFIVANGSRLGIVYGDGSNTGSSSNITEIASFNNNGNVGIGTDSPSSDGGVTLEIRNDATPTLKLNDGGEYQGYLQLRGNDLEVRGSNGAMEFYTGAADGASSTLALTIDSSSFVKTASRLGVGENNPDRLLHLSGNVPIQRFTGNGNNQANYAYVEIEFENSDDSGSAFTVDASIVIRSSESNGNGGQMCFHTGVEGNSERMRISSTGDVSIGKSGVSTSTAGTDLYSYGLAVFVRNNGVVGLFNRLGGDGDLVSFRQDSSEEGTISVSGSTVSYNGFSGLHESSGIANNVAIGTVCSTIDELDVYPDSQPDGKGGTEDHPKKGQTRADHAKIKVSDTEGDKRVYGVLQRYDNNGKPLVASVGIGSIRVTGACEGGDLLESNGDGTAKVQSDDIIRSKTIGKVTIGNSDTGVKLVSCVLYCG